MRPSAVAVALAVALLAAACGNGGSGRCELGALLDDPSACDKSNSCDFGRVIDDHVDGADVMNCGHVVNDEPDEHVAEFEAARRCALAADMERRPYKVEYLEKRPEPYGLAFVGLYNADGEWEVTELSGAIATSTTRYFCTRVEDDETCTTPIDRLCIACQAPARRDTCIISHEQAPSAVSVPSSRRP